MWWTKTNASNGTKDVTITSETDLDDSTEYGIYEDYIQEDPNIQTGISEKTRVNNIYDMAGNVSEWTMEFCYEADATYRGGYGSVISRAGEDYRCEGDGMRFPHSAIYKKISC